MLYVQRSLSTHVPVLNTRVKLNRQISRRKETGEEIGAGCGELYAPKYTNVTASITKD